MGNVLPSGTQPASYSHERFTLSLVNEQSHATTHCQSCGVKPWMCWMGIANRFLHQVLGNSLCPDAPAGCALPGSRPRALPPPSALQIQILLFLAVAPRTGMYRCLFSPEDAQHFTKDPLAAGACRNPEGWVCRPGGTRQMPATSHFSYKLDTAEPRH